MATHPPTTHPLIVATSNPGKLQEMERYLQGSGWQPQLKPPELDVEETGTTFAANAQLKASQIAQATGQWAIADDSGLAIDALDGAPGVYSARYGTSDSDRIARVLQALLGRSDRQAQFICHIAVARPDGEIVLEAEGICPGQITTEPRGTGGFGYDPIFYVPEVGETYAEMTPAQKKQVSHRGRAFSLLVPQLQQLVP